MVEKLTRLLGAIPRHFRPLILISVAFSLGFLLAIFIIEALCVAESWPRKGWPPLIVNISAGRCINPVPRPRKTTHGSFGCSRDILRSESNLDAVARRRESPTYPEIFLYGSLRGTSGNGIRIHELRITWCRRGYTYDFPGIGSPAA